MVALSKEWTLGAWLASPASAPYGFKTLTGAAVALGPDLELSAQALPFAAALLGIAATGLLTFRLTRSAPATWVAAAIVAGDVVLHTQMARVKPYATDLLVVTAVGLCFQSLWEGYSRRRLWTFVVTAVVGLLLSSLALFTVASAATMTAWTAWRRGLRDPQLFAAAAVLVISVGALALATLTTSGFEQLQGHWSRSYLPLDSAAVALGALAETASGWGVRLLHLPAAVPPPVVAALSACLVAFGCVHLWTTRRSAHVGVGVLVFAGVVAAAALQRAPLGVPRIDIFLLPYGAVAIACAFAGVERFSKRLALAAAALLLGTLAVQAPARELTYPLQYSAGLVDRLAGDLGPQDGLIVNIHGTFALAVYGPWQTELADNDRLGVPFPKPPIEHLVVFDRESDLGAVELRRVPRIYVFSCHDVYAVHGSIVRRLEDGGYVSRRSTRNPGCALDLLERS